MMLEFDARRGWLVAVRERTGCTEPWQSVEPGTNQATLIARRGQPREIDNLPAGGNGALRPIPCATAV